MDRDVWDRVLRDAIDDERVSRGERKALREVITDWDLSSADLEWMRARAFAVASEAADGEPARNLIDWLSDVVGLLSHHGHKEARQPQSEAHFAPGEDPLGSIHEQFRRVRQTADVCVFTITDDRIFGAITGAARRGVQVRVLSDAEKSQDRGSDIRALEQVGIPVVLDDSPAHMHHKFAVFDRVRVLTGSFNWTRSATRENCENVLVTDDLALVSAYADEFERLWQRFS